MNFNPISAAGRTKIFKSVDISELEDECLTPSGQLRVVDAEVYRSATQNQICQFCVRHGVYGLPTHELVSYLKAMIGGRSCIEIGAGNGVLAGALGITATDSFQQRLPEVRAHYTALRQTLVMYGKEVIKANALEAVKRFKPQVVLGNWVTHKYVKTRHASGGNSMGIDEGKLIKRVDDYIFLGNADTHGTKHILQDGYLRNEFRIDSLFSRGFEARQNVIWRFSK